MIVGGLQTSLSWRRYRKDNCEIQLIHTKPSQPLRWSEQPLTFSRADHWVHIPDPESYPLVVEPIVEGALLPQTLIDGGSGLNVIFVDTLKKMDIDLPEGHAEVLGIPDRQECQSLRRRRGRQDH
jgi:hypothetical protein